MSRLDAQGTKLEPGFLSIDMEALLRKLPGRSFRSPHHYPVELVRSALVRGARRVDVTIRRGRVVIEDDGPPIPPAVLDGLHRVFDPAASPHERHEAIASFETERGIGLLAAFAPSPAEVRIQTGGLHERHVFRRGHAGTTVPVPKAPGTRITILRSGADTDKEVETLADYVRAATSDVLVNGRLVSRSTDPADAIATTALPPWGNVTSGRAWIPMTGDMCRTWLLDHGVRWSQEVFPSADGLVYEAAIECTAGLPPDLSQRIREPVLGLYRDLARTWRTHRNLRERVEELLFLHYRRTRDRSLVDRFAPFLALGGKRISLSEIRKRSAMGTLHAIRAGDDPTDYITAGSTVLILTPAQWEFLVDHARITLSPPIPAPPPPAWPLRLLQRIQDGASSAISNLGLVRPVPEEEMTGAEKRLVSAVTDELRSGRFILEGVDPKSTWALMSRHRGLHPGRLMDHEGRRILAISRNHPLVRRAVRAVDTDPANLELVLPVLTHGRGLAR